MTYFVVLTLLGVNMPPVNVCILVLGLNSGAYVSEIMRGGILSVDPGQMEAGRAVGLSYSVAMIKIVVPQAVKNILPTLGNELIALIKETSVVSFVGAADLYVAFSYIGSNNYEFMVPYLSMALIYIVMVMICDVFQINGKEPEKSDRRNDLRKNFGGLEVLKGITTAIREGEKVVVVGLPGAAKARSCAASTASKIHFGSIIFEGSILPT